MITYQNKNIFRKLKDCFKNEMRKSGNNSSVAASKTLKSFGFDVTNINFTAWYYNYTRFVKFLHGLTPKRRRAIVRLGRAALKQNTLCDIDNFWEKTDWNLGYGKVITYPEYDLRKIKFNNQLNREEQEKRIEDKIKKINHRFKSKVVASKITRDDALKIVRDVFEANGEEIAKHAFFEFILDQSREFTYDEVVNAINHNFSNECK